MSISDLNGIKKKLLAKHRQYEDPNASEYREGVLGGITVALQTIENMIEEEERDLSQYYGEDPE